MTFDLEPMLARARTKPRVEWMDDSTFDFDVEEEVQAVLAMDKTERVPIVLKALERLAATEGSARQIIQAGTAARTQAGTASGARENLALACFVNRVFRSGVEFSKDDVGTLVQLASRSMQSMPLASLVGALEKLDRRLVRQVVTEHINAIRQAIRRTHPSWMERGDRGRREIERRFEMLLQDEDQIPVYRHDVFAGRMVDDLATVGPKQRAAWAELIRHCLSLHSAKPSKKWMDRARSLTTDVGHDDFVERIGVWFALVDEKRKAVFETEGLSEQDARAVRLNAQTDAARIDEGNQVLLRGLAFAAEATGDDRVLKPIGVLAEASYWKIPSYGARAKTVGTACMTILGRNASPEAVLALSRFRTKFKKSSLKAQIDKALAAAAQSSGMNEDDLEDSVVPGFGLENGRQECRFDDVIGELVIHGSSVSLHWRKGDKTLKSVPSATAKAYPAEVKALKAKTTEVARCISVQKSRLERAFLTERTFVHRVWLRHIAAHPLLGRLAGSLIWRFDGTAALWRDGEAERLDGSRFQVPDGAVVDLWHPSMSPEATPAWQQRLADLEITQPFKQAYRETYVLTEAELRTGDYSNRMAAHIVLQSTIRGLCESRGWNPPLVGSFDGGGPASLNLASHGLLVEFWLSPVGGASGATGLSQFLSSDRVVFFGKDEEVIPLDRVPPRVFSEVMRDVDLFVAVSSVGNDPNWTDDPNHDFGGTYWREFAFGSLVESAKSRRTALERLLPKLSVRDRCRMDGNFVVVEGRLHTYRVHVGSANILIDPDQRYLCIVPAPTRDRIFLPFEGDTTLSLILSKVLMLARDDEIVDPTIVAQLT